MVGLKEGFYNELHATGNGRLVARFLDSVTVTVDKSSVDWEGW